MEVEERLEFVSVGAVSESPTEVAAEILFMIALSKCLNLEADSMTCQKGASPTLTKGAKKLIDSRVC